MNSMYAIAITGFWYFMLLMSLLLPAALVIFGTLFEKKPPKSVNSLYGYRTPMSSKNADTWEFAHKYCGKQWRITGWCLAAVSFVVMLTVINSDESTIGNMGAMLTVVQLVAMIIPIGMTDRALKQTFDKDGNRR